MIQILYASRLDLSSWGHKIWPPKIHGFSASDEVLSLPINTCISYLISRSLVYRRCAITACVRTFDFLHFMYEVSLEVFLECQDNVPSQLPHGEYRVVLQVITVLLHIHYSQRTDLKEDLVWFILHGLMLCYEIYLRLKEPCFHFLYNCFTNFLQS